MLNQKCELCNGTGWIQTGGKKRRCPGKVNLPQTFPTNLPKPRHDERTQHQNKTNLAAMMKTVETKLAPHALEPPPATGEEKNLSPADEIPFTEEELDTWWKLVSPPETTQTMEHTANEKAQSFADFLDHLPDKQKQQPNFAMWVKKILESTGPWFTKKTAQKSSSTETLRVLYTIIAQKEHEEEGEETRHIIVYKECLVQNRNFPDDLVDKILSRTT